MASVTGPEVDATHALVAQTYRETRERSIAVGRAIGDDRGRSERTTACPEWSPADVLAHMAGVCDDILHGKLEGVTTDPWTKAQVDKRASMSMTEICDEWEASGPELDQLLEKVGADIDPRMLFDQWTHEQDLRAALGEPGGQESWAMRRVMPFVLENVTERLDADGVPTIALAVGDHDAIGGVGESVGTLTLSPFEIVRFVSGRRSESQALSYDWPADPAPYLASMPIWGLAQGDVTDAI